MTATRSTSPDDTKAKINLSVAQVAAAALASVTSAVLGSRLGAAGTLIGAAGASAIFTVTSAVYRASLERSQERVRSLARRTRPLPALQDRSGAERAHYGTMDAPPGDDRTGDDRVTDSTEHGTDRAPQPEGRSHRFATLRWGAVVVGAVGAFVLAMMVVTGFEWARGEPLSGDGEGTTIGRVVNAPPGPQGPANPSTPPSTSVPTSATPTETTEPSGSATTSTTDPSGGTSAEPDGEQRPSTTSTPPTPSEPRPTPPLLPTRFPESGG